MEYSYQQNNHSMAWMMIFKPKSKSRILPSLLLYFLIFCFTAQTSALALDKRTNAQSTASAPNPDASIHHLHQNVATRRDTLSEKVPSLKNREPDKDSPSHDMIEVRSEKARTVDDDEDTSPREVGERTTGDEDVDSDAGRVAGRGAGENVASYSFRLRTRT